MRRVIVGAGVAGALSAAWRGRKRRADAKPLVLELNLARVSPKDPIDRRDWLKGALSGEAKKQPMVVRDAAAAIRLAATDARVTGIVADFSEGASLSLADAQELRDAIAVFRKAKGEAAPFTCAYSHEFGSTVDYYTAAALGPVYQLPAGMIHLPAMSTTLPFLRGLLSKWGLRVELVNQGEYKTGADALARAQPTAAHIKSSARLLRSSYEQVIEGVARDRGLSERAVRRLARRGVMSSEEAVREKMIDGCAYPDKLDEIVDASCPGAKRLALADYHS